MARIETVHSRELIRETRDSVEVLPSQQLEKREEYEELSAVPFLSESRLDYMGRLEGVDARISSDLACFVSSGNYLDFPTGCRVPFDRTLAGSARAIGHTLDISKIRRVSEVVNRQQSARTVFVHGDPPFR